MSVDVDSDYLATLGSTDAFADGSLSGDELAADPEAAALVAALQNQIAAQLGVDPDSVTITVSASLPAAPAWDSISPPVGRSRLQ